MTTRFNALRHSRDMDFRFVYSYEARPDEDARLHRGVDKLQCFNRLKHGLKRESLCFGEEPVSTFGGEFYRFRYGGQCIPIPKLMLAI